MTTDFQTDRRAFLARMAFLASAFTTPGVFAEALTRTPAQTEGPFYPDKLPLDTDNDLLIVNDSITPAVGNITHLSGRILDASGSPIRNALVEIWQVDNNGAYLHKLTANRDRRDQNFQGFGRFLTSSTGEYYFRTIKPVSYGAGGFLRTRHIHFKIKKGERELLTTQCYVDGEPQNDKDVILRGIKNPDARKSVIVGFEPIKSSAIGELSARFDIVLDKTPEM